jgi:hypothetical protein
MSKYHGDVSKNMNIDEFNSKDDTEEEDIIKTKIQAFISVKPTSPENQ